ncbi:MAG: serine/threonine protein kinase/tetratricopeptide (TPR) repeat protein [Mariniblastus sp.]|jgi:serine/threonine protein kinase/tetratricopeptide (TPR) repeat protein
MANDQNNLSDPEKLELVVEQFTRRIRDGEHPAISEYQDQHPELKDEIEDLLASVAMIEQLKSSPSQPPSDRRSLNEVSGLKRIGDYEVVGEIGRGGMGIVFEAIHESLGRRVAIKVMPTPLVNSEKYVERFKRESQAAARLHHTNIVGVFGVGEGEGYHYYVMDLVDGQTLSEVVLGLSSGQGSRTTQVPQETQIVSHSQVGSTDAGGSTFLDHTLSPAGLNTPGPHPSNPKETTDSGRLTTRVSPKHFRWAARIGANIADALAYAHESNILHRDIKPSNIILDRKGGVWITDFGLAKDGSNDFNLTKTGDVIGTPQYLSPESLQGLYDERSEVYCLGLTLYELATLKPAYRNGTTAEVIGAIASSSPPSPRKINPRVPIDLSTIIDKSLARNPDKRYQSASELQKDLLAFVEDRPIAARPPSSLENVIKWSRRNPMAAALSAVSALLLVLVAVSATIGYLFTIDALEKEANKSAKLLDQQQETERQRLVAVKENDRAEANITITLQAFDEMFKQVVARGSSSDVNIALDGFEELTGIETSITREDAAFLDKLLVFYDQFAKQNQNNDSLRIESARAFRRVANIYQLIGDTMESTNGYLNAIKSYQYALEQSPDSKDLLISLVQTKCELSSLYRRTQDLTAAISQNESAIALLEDIPAEQLDDRLKLELAKTKNSLGSSSALIVAFERKPPNWWEDMLRGGRGMGPGMGDRRPRRGPEGRGPEGRGPDRRNDSPPPNRSPGDRQSNGDEHPSRPTFGRGGQGRRPGPNGQSKKMDQISSSQSKQAIEILDGLIAKDETNAEYLSIRAKCYCSLAASLRGHDPRKSRELRDKAIDELEGLIAKDPENNEYQFRLALACSLGDPLDSSPEEQVLFQKSVEISDNLIERLPQFLDYHYLRCSVYTKQADRLLKAKQFEESLVAIQKAMNSLDEAVALSHSDRTLRLSLSGLLGHLSRFIQDTEAAGMTKLAADARILADALRQRVRERPPKNNHLPSP